MQDGVHTAALKVQVHEAGGLQRRQAGRAFADLLSAMEALPEAFLAGKSLVLITDLRVLHLLVNGPFAQLLPGLETGHPVTVGQSPTCSFSVSDGREVLFLSPFRAVLGAIHVQVTDRPSPDAPSLTQANNCANGLFQPGHAWLLRYQEPKPVQ